jgi:hypothetical protein
MEELLKRLALEESSKSFKAEKISLLELQYDPRNENFGDFFTKLSTLTLIE